MATKTKEELQEELQQLQGRYLELRRRYIADAREAIDRADARADAARKALDALREEWAADHPGEPDPDGLRGPGEELPPLIQKV